MLASFGCGCQSFRNSQAQAKAPHEQVCNDKRGAAKDHYDGIAKDGPGPRSYPPPKPLPKAESEAEIDDEGHDDNRFRARFV